MTSGQRVMLLCALFFFFIMMLFAIADWGGQKTGRVVANIPRSVMSYPEAMAATGPAVPCYAGAQNERFLAELKDQGYAAHSRATLADGDDMTTYTQESGDFVVVVSGPDKAGITESCSVARGSAFTPAAP